MPVRLQKELQRRLKELGFWLILPLKKSSVVSRGKAEKQPHWGFIRCVTLFGPWVFVPTFPARNLAAITSWRNASAPEPSVGEAMKVLPLTTTPPVSPLLSVVGLCCSLCLYFYSQLQQGSIHCQLGASLPRQELYLLQSTFLELKVKKKVEVLAFGLVCCFFFFLVKRWRETRWKRTWAWD